MEERGNLMADKASSVKEQIKWTWSSSSGENSSSARVSVVCEGMPASLWLNLYIGEALWLNTWVVSIYVTHPYRYYRADLYRGTLRGKSRKKLEEFLEDFACLLVPVLEKVVVNGKVDQKMFEDYVKPLLPMEWKDGDYVTWT